MKKKPIRLITTIFVFLAFIPLIPAYSANWGEISYLELSEAHGLLSTPIRVSDTGYAYLCSVETNSTRLVVVQGGNITVSGQEERYVYVFNDKGLYLVVKLTLPPTRSYGYTYAWCQQSLLVLAYTAIGVGSLVTITERVIGINMSSKSIVFNLNEPIGVFSTPIPSGPGSIWYIGRMVMLNNTLYYMRQINSETAVILSLNISAINNPVFHVEKILGVREEETYTYTPSLYGETILFGSIAYYPANNSYTRLDLPGISRVYSAGLANGNYILLVNETLDKNLHLIAYDVEHNKVQRDINLGYIKGYITASGRPPIYIGDNEYIIAYLHRIYRGPAIFAVNLSNTAQPRFFDIPKGISLMSVFSSKKYVYGAIAAGGQILYVNIDTGKIYPVYTGTRSIQLVDGYYIDIDGDGYVEVLGVFADLNSQHYYVALLGPGVSNNNLDEATGQLRPQPTPEPPGLAAATLATITVFYVLRRLKQLR